MKIRFILNPVSGNKAADVEEIQAQIKDYFPQAEFCVTQKPGHATELAQEAAEQHFDVAVAMGGDGTINETLKGVLGSSTALGIIPRGSGNGFARELGLLGPLDKTLQKLQNAVLQPCDVGYANGEPFLNLAGVGIDATIAWKFAQYGKRGMWPYFKLAAKTLFAYTPPIIRISIDGKQYRWAPLSLAFANNRQYGSNFIIAPHAAIADGKLDLVVLNDAPKYKLIAALPFFFTGSEPPLQVTAYAKIQGAVIESDQYIFYHIDGEPRKTARRLEITLSPHSLRLWVP